MLIFLSKVPKYITAEIFSCRNFYPPKYIMVMALDLCNHFRARNINFQDFRNNCYKVNNTSKSLCIDYIPINFITKEMELLNLNQVFNNKDVFKYFPKKHLNKKYTKEDFRFLTTFKYQQSIRFNITNYSQEIKNASNNQATCTVIFILSIFIQILDML